jgi:hypothetical protein
MTLTDQPRATVVEPDQTAASQTGHTHVRCVSDFCGNTRSPGAWADIFQRHDGTHYVGLGGGWAYYARNTPEIIDEKNPHYLPFLNACDAGDDFAYARKNWS